MSPQLIIRKRAEIHIEEAYSWYEKQKHNLGNDFLQAIEDSINLIKSNPQSFQFKYKNIRVIYTKRFPYGIFYLIDSEKIILMAVFHVSRNPKLWKRIIGK